MKIDTEPKKIDELLTRGVEEVIVFEDLKKKLLSGRQLRIKFGVDPTAPDLHIGHAVPLRKLKQFQALGHKVILLIGDYTAMIGDPSGRNVTRPMLTKAEVKKNMKTYIKQAGRILDMKKVELRYNSDWYKNKGWAFLMDLTGKITVARVLDRDDFQKRLKEGTDIQMQEIFYPLMQGYDSVELKSDVEIGGSDQKFNMLMGRRVQKRYDQPEQEVMTFTLLEGTDGEKKMSKTYGNFIALLDPPEEMFGKVMSIPDKLITKYFELATEVASGVIAEYKKQMEAGKNPRDIKTILAKEITKIYHGEKAAAAAQINFDKMFRDKELPEEMIKLHTVGSSIILLEALTSAGLASSRSEARRLLEQGGVKVDGNVVKDPTFSVPINSVIQKGKRGFVRIVRS
jgi:tyrosyl-tRNA synthetase